MLTHIFICGGNGGIDLPQEAENRTLNPHVPFIHFSKHHCFAGVLREIGVRGHVACRKRGEGSSSLSGAWGDGQAVPLVQLL